MGLRKQSKEGNILRKHLLRFKRDKRAAIYAWVMVTLSIFTYSIMWFTAGWSILEVADTMKSEFDLGTRGDAVADMLNIVFAYHPVIVILGFIMYGLASSVKRDVRIDYM